MSNSQNPNTLTINNNLPNNGDEENNNSDREPLINSEPKIDYQALRLEKPIDWWIDWGSLILASITTFSRMASSYLIIASIFSIREEIYPINENLCICLGWLCFLSACSIFLFSRFSTTYKHSRNILRRWFLSEKHNDKFINELTQRYGMVLGYNSTDDEKTETKYVYIQEPKDWQQAAIQKWSYPLQEGMLRLAFLSHIRLNRKNDKCLLRLINHYELQNQRLFLEVELHNPLYLYSAITVSPREGKVFVLIKEDKKDGSWDYILTKQWRAHCLVTNHSEKYQYVKPLKNPDTNIYQQPVIAIDYEHYVGLHIEQLNGSNVILPAVEGIDYLVNLNTNNERTLSPSNSSISSLEDGLNNSTASSAVIPIKTRNVKSKYDDDFQTMDGYDSYPLKSLAYHANCKAKWVETNPENIEAYKKSVLGNIVAWPGSAGTSQLLGYKVNEITRALKSTNHYEPKQNITSCDFYFYNEEGQLHLLYLIDLIQTKTLSWSSYCFARVFSIISTIIYGITMYAGIDRFALELLKLDGLPRLIASIIGTGCNLWVFICFTIFPMILSFEQLINCWGSGLGRSYEGDVWELRRNICYGILACIGLSLQGSYAFDLFLEDQKVSDISYILTILIIVEVFGYFYNMLTRFLKTLTSEKILSTVAKTSSKSLHAGHTPIYNIFWYFAFLDLIGTVITYIIGGASIANKINYPKSPVGSVLFYATWVFIALCSGFGGKSHYDFSVKASHDGFKDFLINFDKNYLWFTEYLCGIKSNNSSNQLENISSSDDSSSEEKKEIEDITTDYNLTQSYCEWFLGLFSGTNASRVWRESMLEQSYSQIPQGNASDNATNSRSFCWCCNC